MIILLTVLITVVIILIPCYYFTVLITLMSNDFKTQKDLKYASIPFYSWYIYVKRIYQSLPKE